MYGEAITIAHGASYLRIFIKCIRTCDRNQLDTVDYNWTTRSCEQRGLRVYIPGTMRTHLEQPDDKQSKARDETSDIDRTAMLLFVTVSCKLNSTRVLPLIADLTATLTGSKPIGLSP